jgi:hypothetical protein
MMQGPGMMSCECSWSLSCLGVGCLKCGLRWGGLDINTGSAGTTQVTSNLVGVGVAATNVVTAALNAVLTGSMQREAGVDGNQLLYGMSPYVVVLWHLLCPFLSHLALTMGRRTVSWISS